MMEKVENNEVLDNNIDDLEIKDSTGEVIDKPQEFKGFRSMWSNPYGCETVDCSNQFEEVFVELPPYAIDPETGNFLNNSSQPKLVSKGKINVWEKIQSFKKEVDLYSILEKFAYSGDQALLNARACAYGDISNIPDNINDYTDHVQMHIDRLKSLNPELAKKVLDDSISSLDIEAEANNILNKRIDLINKKDESEEKIK